MLRQQLQYLVRIFIPPANEVYMYVYVNIDTTVSGRYLERDLTHSPQISYIDSPWEEDDLINRID